MSNFQKQNILFLLILTAIFLVVSKENNVSVKKSVKSADIIAHVNATEQSNNYISNTENSDEYEYLEITNSCDANFEGVCIPAYSGPGLNYEKILDLRNGMILKIRNKKEVNGQIWYQVYFDEWLRHPDRVDGDWYIPAVAGNVVTSGGLETMNSTTAPTTKRIVVDRSEHMIYAYDGNILFLSTKISTGTSGNPTPLGTFHIYKKTPSRYMQGPIPGVTDLPYDLPGVPWDMYFTEDGAVIHGSYWHSLYGTDQSKGCINLPPELSKILYDWADLGTPVIIQE